MEQGSQNDTIRWAYKLKGLALTGCACLALSACGLVDNVTSDAAAVAEQKTVSHQTTIPFSGDYQQAYDQITRFAQTCFSDGGHQVKSLQLRADMPGQVDIFDKSGRKGDPLPGDLRVKAFLKPTSDGGELKLETFSSTGDFAHEQNKRRFIAWLSNQEVC